MRLSSNHILSLCLASIAACWMVSCAPLTSGVPDGDKLYVGIDHINYSNYEDNDHFANTKIEVDAALALPPNGSLFGSSTMRSPFQPRLMIWNYFSKKDSKFADWMTKSFGRPPVLLSGVNPELRASVAQSALQAHGYFRGKVTSEVVDTRHPKKGKVGYTVDLGHLFTVDTLEYVNFPTEAMALIDSTAKEALIHSNDPFDISTLDNERNRVSTLLRDNGYYFYQPGYASYLADTLSLPGSAKMKLQLADSLPPQALRKYYIGKVDFDLRKTMRETLDNHNSRRNFTVNFHGRKQPMRMGVILRDVKLRSGNLFSYSDYQETMSKLTGNGLFSMVNFTFTPRDSLASTDTLDMRVNCVFDKPYDFYIEGNINGKTSGFFGPQLVVGLTKRNAFKGGEKLNVNLHGSYEWLLSRSFDEDISDMNSYEYGGDVSLEIPRFETFFFKRKRGANNANRTRTAPRRRRYYSTPTTTLKASSNTINRSGYFKRHVVSGELSYHFQPSRDWQHHVTPLSVEYNYLKETSAKFDEMLESHPYLLATMSDVFIPKMKYTVYYSQPKSRKYGFYWDASISESANLVSLAYTAFGKSWAEKDKKLFKNPYAQFVKLETNVTKTWDFTENSQLVAHFNAGVAWAFGNSTFIPYTEKFWVGGANSIRAFSVRSIGPGKYHTGEKRWRYIEETGDMKLQANLEYRSRLFGNLYGAVFLDAGNVWELGNEEEQLENSVFRLSNLLDELAVGTGIGIRYDLEFFVIRLDWGIGIHVPYETDKSGYFNIPSFGKGQSIHFAIGYPF